MIASRWGELLLSAASTLSVVFEARDRLRMFRATCGSVEVTQPVPGILLVPGIVGDMDRV